MLLSEKLLSKNIILASSSPRRQELFKELGLNFKIKLKPVEEVYPEHLKHSEITNYLAQLKAAPFKEELIENDILVTSDTIVWNNNKALGKPKDEQEAFNMLLAMSGKTHEVITSICVTTKGNQLTEFAVTKVTFKSFSNDEIWHYIKTYKPFDKAGGYGIQEWIGLIGVININGSYNTVVGLPTHLLYHLFNSLQA